jgi:hypothetical protein
MALRYLAACVALGFVGLAGAQTPPAPVAEMPAGTQPALANPQALDCLTVSERKPCDRLWGGAEYLLWWVQGQRVPALVTTSPPGTPIGQAGVLGLPGTSVLFGDTRMNDGGRSGVRLTIGMWLDDCRTCGVGGEFFILGNQGDNFSARSSGISSILARPFFNTLSQSPYAHLVSLDPRVFGSVSASVESQLLGASAFFRHPVCCGSDFSLEAIAGYRYLNLNERVTINESARTGEIAPGLPVPQVSFLLYDSFQTQTQFHGGDFGLAARLNSGRFSFSALGKVALGANIRDLTIAGSTGITVPGTPPASVDGGLLTVGRTGHVSDSIFACVPELRLGVGYRVASGITLTAGYNLIWWSNVARAGDQIDLRVNPALLPPAQSPAIATPAIRDTSIWIQGLAVGVMFNY